MCTKSKRAKEISFTQKHSLVKLQGAHKPNGIYHKHIVAILKDSDLVGCGFNLVPQLIQNMVR